MVRQLPGKAKKGKEPKKVLLRRERSVKNDYTAAFLSKLMIGLAFLGIIAIVLLFVYASGQGKAKTLQQVLTEQPATEIKWED
jgi:flagellar biosynthesis/type III secretory pathway M-ring protein FliF/YscJ